MNIQSLLFIILSISFLFTILLTDERLDFSWWHMIPNTFFLWTYQIFGNFLILCCCSLLFIFFKFIQNLSNRDFVPVLSGMLFAYAISRLLFFIKIILEDRFFFVWESHDFCKESCVWLAETNDGEPLNRLTCNTMTFPQKWRHCSAISFQKKQEVQGLQTFAFSVVTVNDENRKPGFKIKCRG